MLFNLIFFAVIVIIISITCIKSALKEKRRKRYLEKYNKFLDSWLINIEPLYRFEKGYPPDWETRRQYVLNRNGRKCMGCGKIFPVYFKPTNNWENVLLRRDDFLVAYGWVADGFHVHHRTPIREGGDHSLDNLISLCEDCHTSQKGHELLRRSVNLRKYRMSMRYVHDAKVKKARKNYSCSVCELPISSGEEYYGGRFGGKLCVKCYNKIRNK